MLYLESFLFSSWDVTLETNGKAETIISSDPSAISQVKNADAAFSFGGIQNVTDQFSKGIIQMTDGAGKLFTYGEKFVNLYNKLLPKKKVQDKDKETILKQLNNGTDLFSKVGELLGLPSFLSGVINSFIGTNKKPATFQFAHTDINLKTTGTLRQESQFNAIPIRNPGSDKSGFAEELSPVYNNRLGIFNILELPRIEYMIYQPLSSDKSIKVRTVLDNVPPPNISQKNLVAENVSNCLSNACGTYLASPQPPKVVCNKYTPKYRPNIALPIYHYKVVSPLKFVINPASDLRLVSIKTSLVFQIGKNNYPTGEGQFTPTQTRITNSGGGATVKANEPEAWDELNAVGFSTDVEKNKTESELRLNKLGYDLLSKRFETTMDSSYIATPMITPSCIENTSFLMANGFVGGEKKVSLRVSLILEPKTIVPGSTVDKVLQTYTFDYDDASITKIVPAIPVYYTDKVSYTYFITNGFYNTCATSNAQRLTNADFSYQFAKGFMQIPTQINFKGATVNGGTQCIPIGDQDLFVLGDINIDGQICYTTNPVKFYTTGDVNLLNGSTLPSNITVVKRTNDPCGLSIPVETDPTTVCNSATYTTLSQSYRIDNPIVLIDTLNKNKTSNIANVLISPNPVSNYFNVSLDILKKTKIRVDVLSTISQLQPTTSLNGDIVFEKGKYQFKLSSDMLASGMYFVKITAGKDIVIKKLIIQR